jgi:ADP-heptose:LPS heptosyltransferase/glycosyltransferase involved in cell wall biosynthesis
MKKRVLFVGENPLGTTGNSNMLSAMLSDLDLGKYQPGCFVVNEVNPSAVLFDPLPFTLVNGTNPSDYWGNQRLISLLQETQFDFLCMVGIDFWRYIPAWDMIKKLRDAKKFKWIGIFPYDLWKINTSWINRLTDLDFPCVYSQFGYDALKPHVPHIQYYRPRLNGWEQFKPLSSEERLAAKKEVFPNIPIGKTIFGFVGQNQIRKSPERLMKAFMEAKRENPDIVLYLHTNMEGVFNLKQIAKDNGAQNGDLVSKQQGISYDRRKMPDIYNAMDCLINCSMQEGLSWTPLEAMACGTPVIASVTTAQTELVDKVGYLVPCDELSFVPMTGEGENVSAESRACKVEDIRNAILTVAKDEILRQSMGEKGIERAREWMAGTSNINDLLETAGKKQKPASKIAAVLFAQHSAAGDVLMTTQCLKGIKERHPDLPLVYMTQRAFAGILENNQYINEIIEWDERLLRKFAITYNPHGEKILPGGWNNLDVTLHSMYPYFTNVDTDEIFIDTVNPEVLWKEKIEFPMEYIVVHTTGGSKEYRTYPHMEQVIKGLSIPTVQVGGATDLRCNASLDLCGKTTWRESAYIMKHAKAAIVVDSFMSHLAGAVGTNAVVLYGPAPARVVQPRMQHGAKLINLQPDMLKVCAILSHCWSNPPGGKVKCQSPCIGTINPFAVSQALEGLL